MKFRLLALLALLPLASCTTMSEGRVVRKRSRPVEPGFSRLGATYTLEIAGTDAKGKLTRKTVLVSEQEWLRVRIGDHYSPKAPHVRSEAAAHPPHDKDNVSEETGTKTRKPATSAKPSPKKSKEPEVAMSQPGKTPQLKAKNTEPKVAAKPSPSPSPSSPTPSPSPTSPTPSPSSPSPARVSQLTYDEAEARAAEDPRVRELKQKIHAASTEDEQKKAADDYYKTLYGKMRELAPAARARIDKEEAAKLHPAASPAR